MSYLIAGYVILFATPIIYLTITGSFAYLIQMFAVFGMIIGVILLLIGGILYFRSHKPEK